MPKKVVILVTGTGLGTTAPDDEPFGREMLEKFFHALESQPRKPYAICFYTEGVKAACDGAPCVLGLKLLEGLGVKLVACESCLNYYDLADSLVVGQPGGMNAIVGLMAEADQVITV